jgi:hypothetical protein
MPIDTTQTYPIDPRPRSSQPSSLDLELTISDRWAFSRKFSMQYDELYDEGNSGEMDTCVAQ